MEKTYKELFKEFQEKLEQLEYDDLLEAIKEGQNIGYPSQQDRIIQTA